MDLLPHQPEAPLLDLLPHELKAPLLHPLLDQLLDALLDLLLGSVTLIKLFTTMRRHRLKKFPPLHSYFTGTPTGVSLSLTSTLELPKYIYTL